MSWTVYGERFIDSDFSGSPRVFQPFTLARDTKLKALMTWFILVNAPSLTTLGMKIYDDKNGSPTVLKATFTKTFTLAQALTTYNHGIKQLGFDFTNPLWLKADTTYHFVPYVAGSALTNASHIAWMRGFPDPNTTQTVTLAPTKISQVPFYLGLIGAD